VLIYLSQRYREALRADKESKIAAGEHDGKTKIIKFFKASSQRCAINFCAAQVDDNLAPEEFKFGHEEFILAAC
jgi:hypothetical protein